MSEFPAGWYDDGSGLQRWWDGSGWTEDVLADRHQDGSANPKAGLFGTLQDFGARITARHDPSTDRDAIWGAVSKPIGGIGASGYKLTVDYLIIEKGLFSTNGQQIRMRDVLEVSAAQNVSQKIRGVGSIIVRVSGPSGDQRVVLEDIPDFRHAATLIGKTADEAQSGRRPRTGTPHDEDSATSSRLPKNPPTGSPVSIHAPSPDTAPDQKAAAMGLNTELLRLVQLHADGILTDGEFAAAKAKLLGL